MAVRAPRPANRHNHHLPIKLRIRIRNHFARKIRKTKGKTAPQGPSSLSAQ